MLLDRIDIDSHGPIARVGLGPFSQQLNVVCAPPGAGKTALVRFLRDSLTGTTPAYGGLAGSSGRVVWAAADGLYHCRREPNGTKQGRRFVEFETRLGFETDRGLHSSVVVDLPASIVDAVVTDTTRTSVARIVENVIVAGLDVPADSADDEDRFRRLEANSLRSEIEHLRLRLRDQGYREDEIHSNESIRNRLAALTIELSAIDSRREYSRHTAAALDSRRRDRQSLDLVVREIDRLRSEETDLRRRLTEVADELAQIDRSHAEESENLVTARLTRERIQWLGRHISQLRRVLAEVRSLGDLWFSCRAAAGTAPHGGDHSPLTREELEVADRGWLSAARENRSVDVLERLDAVSRLVDRLAGRLDAEQEQPHRTLGLEEELSVHAAQSDAARGRSSVNRLSASASDPDSDPAWVDDSLRRLRLEALRRAERLRRLETLADGLAADCTSEDSLHAAIRNMGAALQGVTRRLRGLQEDFAPHAARHLGARHLGMGDASLTAAEQAETLRRCERELVGSLQQLAEQRVAVLRRIAKQEQLPQSLLDALAQDSLVLPEALDRWLASRADASVAGESADSRQTLHARRVARRRSVEQQQQQLEDRLAETVDQMNSKLGEAESLQVQLTAWPGPANDDCAADRRDEIESEMHRLYRQLTAPAVDPDLLARYRRAVARMEEIKAAGGLSGTLASAASQHLRRLSGGRLQNIHWHSDRGRSGSATVSVTIDSRTESQYSELDRTAAVLAVRMAAADELSRRGRPLPLVVELPARLLGNSQQAASHRSGETEATDSRIELIVRTLADTARRGRQVLLLTDHAVWAEAAKDAGGRTHRWYRPASATLRTDDVNRDFDIQWRETFGDPAAVGIESDSYTLSLSGTEEFDRPVVAGSSDVTSEQRLNGSRTAVAAGVPSADADHAPAADRPTSGPRRRSRNGDVVAFPIRPNRLSGGSEAGESNSFFLTDDSPIEQSPSIDALAAARLRALGIVVVGQLLQAAPGELAEAIRMNDVNASTVRRWQNECRLVCGVAGLRGFDARVLVGCGIVHPSEIAAMEPAELVERVETFLATDRGVRILRTGTGHEVSRLTGWIAEARRTATGGSKKTAADRPTSAATNGAAADDAKRKGASRSRTRREKLSVKSERVAVKGEDGKRFYLQYDSEIRQAPSIGPRMAERLRRIGIRTVKDLLRGNPTTIADGLKLRKIAAAVVRAWQQQATLMCRVPGLRGHDAQLLVAAGITEAERLANCDPQWLVGQIDPISRSREGQYILRGGNEPDLAEVTQWIHWARQARELKAA